MKRWKTMVLVIAMLAAPTPLAAEPAAWTLARFSFSSGWDAVPAVVAIDRGFFAQEELVVDGLARSSEGPLAQSLVAGSTDFATVSQRTLLVMAALQIPVKVISMNGWGTEMEVVVPKVDTAIKTAADLKGKTIGLGMASEAYPVLIRLLNKAKLRPTDVKIKYLSPNDLTQAFKDNARLADAVIESRHYTATLVETGQARVALANKDIVSTVGFIGAAPLIIRTALIEKEPATVQKFLNAWVKALTYIQQDPEDAARLMAIFFHRQGVVNVRGALVRSWLSMSRYGRAVWSKDDIADAEYNGWALKEGGILKVAPTLSGYVENRFAEEAVKRLAADGGARESQKAPARR
jgi:ABC-type nitrate/sulfonate/bicarbonate transport system substrate-binding protein